MSEDKTRLNLGYEERTILSKINSLDSKLQESELTNYAIDNCACPPCGCQKTIYTVILSPAGIAAASGAYLVASPL